MCVFGMSYRGDLADSQLDANSSLGVEIDGRDVSSGDVVALVDELVVVCLLLECIRAWDKALHAADNILENITLLDFLRSLALLIRGRDDRVKERGNVILFSQSVASSVSWIDGITLTSLVSWASTFRVARVEARPRAI